MYPFIGEIQLFPFNFAPKNWMLCNGQILPISSNTALFSLLGTTYGGDGKTSFALPNLQSVVVSGAGAGPGLTPVALGETYGEANVTLLETEMPAHSHSVTLLNNNGTVQKADSTTYLAKDSRGGSGGNFQYATNEKSATNPMNIMTLSTTGGTLPHTNQQPFLVLNYCIAVTGVFPARN